MRVPPPATLDRVAAVLPTGPPGIQVKVISARVGDLAPATVGSMMAHLVRDGRAVYSGEDGKRLYWRGGQYND